MISVLAESGSKDVIAGPLVTSAMAREPAGDGELRRHQVVRRAGGGVPGDLDPERAQLGLERSRCLLALRGQAGDERTAEAERARRHAVRGPLIDTAEERGGR